MMDLLTTTGRMGMGMGMVSTLPSEMGPPLSLLPRSCLLLTTTLFPFGCLGRARAAKELRRGAHSPTERRALLRRRKAKHKINFFSKDSSGKRRRLFSQWKPVVLHTFPMCCKLFVTKKFLFTCRDQFGGKKSIRIKNRLNGARVGLLRGNGTQYYAPHHNIKSFPSNPVQLHECRKFIFYGPDLPYHFFPPF